MENRCLTWGRVILWMVLFFPIGIALLIAKMRSDLDSLKSGLTGIGIIFIIFGLSDIDSGMRSSDFISVAVLLIIGITALIGSRIAKIKINYYSKYLKLITEENIYDTNEIAILLHKDKSVVVTDLQKMIKTGYLYEYCMDLKNWKLCLNQDKSLNFKIKTSATMLNKITMLKAWYWFWFCATFVILMNFGVENISDFIATVLSFIIIFGLIGIPAVLSARTIKKNLPRYIQYIELIVNQNQSNIEDIALAVGEKVETTTIDLHNMIFTGYLKGYDIDQNNQNILLEETINQSRNDNSTSETENSGNKVILTKAERIYEDVVECQSCGAKNKVKVGFVSECVYCGTPLKA